MSWIERITSGLQQMLGQRIGVAAGTGILDLAVTSAELRQRRDINVSDPYGLYRTTFESHFREFVYYYMYKNNPWVRACVNNTADEATRLDFLVVHNEEGMENADAEALRDWLVEQNLKNMLNAVLRDVLVFGKGFAAIEPTRGGDVAGLYRLDARITDPVIDENNNLLGYAQTWMGLTETWEIDEAIYWYVEGPPGPWQPDPLLDSLLDSVEIDARQRKFKNAFLKNAALISMILETQSTDRETIQHNRQYVKSELSGESKAGRALVLGGINKLLHFGSPTLDIALRDLAAIPRQEICAVYDVPESELGIGDDANRATKGGMRESYIEGTVVPWQQTLAGTFTKQFIHRVWDDEDLALQPRPFPKRADGDDAKVAEAGAKIGAPRNSLLGVLGLPEVPGPEGEALVQLAPANTVEMVLEEGEEEEEEESESEEDEEEPENEEDEKEEEPRSEKANGRGDVAPEVEKQDDDAGEPGDGAAEEHLSELEEWTRTPQWMQELRAKAAAAVQDLAREQMDRRRLTFSEIPDEEWERAEAEDAAEREAQE